MSQVNTEKYKDNSAIVKIKKTQVEPLTKEELIKLFPSRAKTITDEVVSHINNIIDNPEFDGYKLIEAMCDYQDLMQRHRTSIRGFADAIKFCSCLENGDSTRVAYIKTFWYRSFVQERKDVKTAETKGKELTYAAHRYKNSPLIKELLTVSALPLHLMFMGGMYKAAMVLLNEAQNAKLSRDRINAADKFLLHVKPPENLRVELDIGIKKDNVVDQYEQALANMLEKQKQALANGMSIDKVANVEIVEVINDD